MTLEPQKHGHGGEPDKNKIHRAYIYCKFVRYVFVIVGISIAINSFTDYMRIMNEEIKEIKLWNSIPITTDTAFYISVAILVSFLIFNSWMLGIFGKRYKIIKHLHIAYCKCDKNRWYNK